MSLPYRSQVYGDRQPPSIPPTQQQPPPPPYEFMNPAEDPSSGQQHAVPGSYPHARDHWDNRRESSASPRPEASRRRGKQSSSPQPEASSRRHEPKTSSRPSAAIEDSIDDREKVHIAIMGITGSGKSSFIQLCSKSNNVKVGHGLKSCTNKIGEHEFVWRDKHICLIDTPGFDDTTRTDREVLDDIAEWLGTAYQDKIELTGILYLQRILDPRMSGVAFDNLTMFKKLCDKEYYPRVTLATTMWDITKPETAEAREAELLSDDDFWRDMTRNGCKVERHYGDRESAMDILRGIMQSRNKNKAPTFTQVQKEMVDEQLSLEETSAGRQVNAKIEQERIKLQKDLERAKRDMQESMKEHDQHMANRYKKKQEELEMKLARGYQDQEEMKVKLTHLQEQQAQQLEEAQRELERTRAELQESREELERKRREAERLNPDDPRAQKLQEEIEQTEDQLADRDDELAAQEEYVNKKKKKWYKRISRWAKENPNAVKTASAVIFQFVAAAAKASR